MKSKIYAKKVSSNKVNQLVLILRTIRKITSRVIIPFPISRKNFENNAHTRTSNQKQILACKKPIFKLIQFVKKKKRVPSRIAYKVFV